MTLEEARRCAGGVLDEVGRAIVGKRDVSELVLASILARGHVLVEDYPGLAKTLMARSFASTLGLTFGRVQFTPDLLPADITGSFVYDQRRSQFDFRRGPLFANLVLGDEINRAPPKTQAALLEAMQEQQITVEDSTYQLDDPFIVIATENPIEFEGTYPLPEAQLDRFIARVTVGYPQRDEQWEILLRRIERKAEEIELRAVVDTERLLQMQRTVEEVEVDEKIGYYIVDLVEATRSHGDVDVGASPRGALATLKLARSWALLRGRDFVTPEDVKAVAVPALAHRLTLRPELWVRRVGGDEVVAAILDELPAPSARELEHQVPQPLNHERE